MWGLNLEDRKFSKGAGELDTTCQNFSPTETGKKRIKIKKGVR